MRYRRIISIILFTLNSILVTGCHLLYDYKRLCEEELQNCIYELITLPVINVKALSEFFDKKDSDNSNDWVVEVKFNNGSSLFLPSHLPIGKDMKKTSSNLKENMSML